MTGPGGSDDSATIERIRRFLLATVEQGYAGTTATTLDDGTHRLVVTAAGIVADDAWAGGDPFGGRLLLAIDGRPAWVCAYHGAVVDADEDPLVVYAFLREALRATPADLPIRGPGAFIVGDLAYGAAIEGDLGRFAGREWIARGGSRIYEGSFVGGLVDRRQG